MLSMPERPWRKGFGRGQRFDLFKDRFQISRHRQRCIFSRDLFKDTLLINESAKWKKERKKKKKPPHGGIQTRDISIMGCLSYNWANPNAQRSTDAHALNEHQQSMPWNPFAHYISIDGRICRKLLQKNMYSCDPANIANVRTEKYMLCNIFEAKEFSKTVLVAHYSPQRTNP